jgi:hypothetical protein
MLPSFLLTERKFESDLLAARSYTAAVEPIRGGQLHTTTTDATYILVSPSHLGASVEIPLRPDARHPVEFHTVPHATHASNLPRGDWHSPRYAQVRRDIQLERKYAEPGPGVESPVARAPGA